MHSRIIKSDMNNFRGVKSYLKGKIKGKLPEMDSILERYKIYMGEKYVIIPRSIIRSNDSEVVFFLFEALQRDIHIKEKLLCRLSRAYQKYIAEKPKCMKT